ncbi:sensor histidine kinase [Kutzneria sp. CA-103260]|uniref:sensor histidine kinase n=1 Tax=Kutzneria sp. CA-103260 TaxID=2802641 RepID=UPI001BAA742E|nr:sensor histidine kinase [Kutzneria sp. CA-103260]QUQ64322.1 histidine kinase [Kutzneria sp. CA-103260]
MRETVWQSGRATAHLARAAGLALATYVFITMLLLAAAGAMVVIGIGAVPETVLLVRKIAGTKRRQVGEWTGRPIPEAYLAIPGPLRESLRAAVRDPCTYGDLRWMLAYYGYGPLGVLAVPLWLLGLLVDGVGCGLLRRRAVVLPLISRLADLDAAWSTALLKPPPKARLAERVRELAETRAGAVAAHGAELRRIERDLHDGVQARLVSMSMRIGLAKRAYEKDPAAGRKLLDDAQAQAEEALTELRHVVRGIHPPILTDRGLVGAVRALAAGSGLTVDVDGDDDGLRAPAAVEAAAYFVVAEALTNAAKHSGVDRAEVRLARTDVGLRVWVRDEGRGGAEAEGADGSGLLGMRRRVAALDGTMTVTSPAGGPTTIEVELPCVW